LWDEIVTLHIVTNKLRLKNNANKATAWLLKESSTKIMIKNSMIL